MYCSETEELVFVCGWSGTHFIMLKSTSDHLDVFRRDYSSGKSDQHEVNLGKCQLPMHTSVQLSSIPALKVVFLFLQKGLGIEVLLD